MNLMNLENKKQLATILVAVALGIVAVFAASQYVQKEVNSQTRALAKDYQKKNATLINELELMKREMGRVAAAQKELARRQSQQKTVVVPAKQTPQIDASPFSTRTPRGKRAYTIRIDSLSAIGGLINPGDKVDIVGKLKVPDKGPVTSVLFQNVEVLAVGTNFKQAGDIEVYSRQQVSNHLNVTLALSPEEAGLMAFAQDNGSFKLSLRSPSERETEVLQVASWETLAEYVMREQGTEIKVPSGKRHSIKEMGEDEVRPFIRIFKSGRESSL